MFAESQIGSLGRKKLKHCLEKAIQSRMNIYLVGQKSTIIKSQSVFSVRYCNDVFSGCRKPYEVCTVITSILWRKKLRHREPKKLARGYLTIISVIALGLESGQLGYRVQSSINSSPLPLTICLRQRGRLNEQKERCPTHSRCPRTLSSLHAPPTHTAQATRAPYLASQ